MPRFVRQVRRGSCLRSARPFPVTEWSSSGPLSGEPEWGSGFQRDGSPKGRDLGSSENDHDTSSRADRDAGRGSSLHGGSGPVALSWPNEPRPASSYAGHRCGSVGAAQADQVETERRAWRKCILNCMKRRSTCHPRVSGQWRRRPQHPTAGRHFKRISRSARFQAVRGHGTARIEGH